MAQFDNSLIWSVYRLQNMNSSAAPCYITGSLLGRLVPLSLHVWPFLYDNRSSIAKENISGDVLYSMVFSTSFLVGLPSC